MLASVQHNLSALHMSQRYSSQSLLPLPPPQGQYEAALQIYDSQVGLCLEFALMARLFEDEHAESFERPCMYQYTREAD